MADRQKSTTTAPAGHTNRKTGFEGARIIANKYNAEIIEETVFSKDKTSYTLKLGQPGSMLYSLWRKVTVTRPIAEKEKAQQEFYEKAKALDEAMEEGKTEEE